ncbi:Nuf2 family-domain-containing protein [Kalaharituber pfeilii]|nr:Nuf2 family-domain-containing protein [Kalaharituber pfeilii]
MSYRPRESIAFRGSQNPRQSVIGGGGGLPSSQGLGISGNRSGDRRPKPEPDENEEIFLRDDEIVECLKAVGINFSLGDLKSPLPAQVQIIYEQLVEDLMGVRRETVEPLLKYATAELEFPETHRDSMALMAFYKSLSRLMLVCNVTDFSFQDLLKPDYKRLRIHLSQIINFMRYRHDSARRRLIQEQLSRPDEARNKLHELVDENESLQDNINRTEEQIERDKPQIELAKETNESLTQDLRSMKKRQESLVNDFDKERNERKSMAAALQDREYLKVKLKQECDKIRPYIVDSPDKLQQVITDMNNTLITEKTLCDTLERKIRALQTSTESFIIIEADVSACIKVMEECESELVKVEEMSRKVSRHEEILKSRENENKDIERKEALLQRQLETLKEKIEKSRATAEQKREMAQKRMEELKGVYDELSRERQEKNKEMDKKKMRIEQIEKQMMDLKEAIEDEVHRTHNEMARMKAHIETYIREMEQRMSAVGM